MMENEEKTKQKNIKIIIELLKKEPPDKVFEILIFIQSYLSQ